MSPQLVHYKDPTKLRRWVIGLSYLCIAASILGLFAGYLEYVYLQNSLHDLFPTEEAATVANAWQEKWVVTAGVLQSAILFQVIAFFAWIYRMNANTRSISIQLKYTPKWSILWFFIPIANIWKPYQVLKELWTSNHPPSLEEVSRRKGTPFIAWFWVVAFISFFLGNRVLVMSLKAQELPELIPLNKITFLSDTVDIPFYVLSIILVERLYKMHLAKFAPLSQEHHQLIRALPTTEESEKKAKKMKWVRGCALTLLFIFIALMMALFFFTWADHPS